MEATLHILPGHLRAGQTAPRSELLLRRTEGGLGRRRRLAVRSSVARASWRNRSPAAVLCGAGSENRAAPEGLPQCCLQEAEWTPNPTRPLRLPGSRAAKFSGERRDVPVPPICGTVRCGWKTVPGVGQTHTGLLVEPVFRAVGAGSSHGKEDTQAGGSKTRVSGGTAVRQLGHRLGIAGPGVRV